MIESIKNTNAILKLKYLGRDIYDRPVYRDTAITNNTLYVDVNPYKGSDPSICTKYNNMFDGEAESPVNDNIKIEFDGKRELWLG